jgi:hypothetical protein
MQGICSPGNALPPMKWMYCPLFLKVFEAKRQPDTHEKRTIASLRNNCRRSFHDAIISISSCASTPRIWVGALSFSS